MADRTTSRIAAIVGNRSLARAIQISIHSGRTSRFIHLAGGKDVWSVFNSSLSAAIRDIEGHPLGLLFRRLIEFGPHNPDDPEAPTSDGKTTLSDPECARCVEFIFSHMINRFKGELAELLAVGPVWNLVKELQKAGNLPSHIAVYFGDTIQERRKGNESISRTGRAWSGFAKGADGLITKMVPVPTPLGHKILMICGVVEVKSMHRSSTRLEAQMNHHVQRMAGGIKLNGKLFDSSNLRIGLPQDRKDSVPAFITVAPSKWKLDRKWYWEQKNDKRVMHLPDPPDPKEEDLIEQVGPTRWRIKLAWSQDALNQAAYEMTYWYMSQVGKAIYSRKPLPKDWKGMTPEEAGYNAIKMMLYYIPLRIKHFQRPGIPREQLRKYRQRIDEKATRLYNVYCFGYPLGIDSREMLWPEDFPENQANDNSVPQCGVTP